MKTPIILFLSLLFYTNLVGQSFTIEGMIQDESATGLAGATIVVLDNVDTTMMAFGVTDEEGKFKIFEVPSGAHLLQVSYTGYRDRQLPFSVESENKIFEPITMSVSTELLKEVNVKAEHIPMGILGDTINYNASAFQTRPGASVEDLLKRLPGIEVARDGSIKAQGEDVENVLVDGKEFFSGDPTIATKNLEAEAIDKVQVFDKQSEEAEFTGIEDGGKEKTINLKLKEGYKSGGFGRVEAHGGTANARLAKANYNRFSKSLQTSLIANTNNINEQAFSFNEYTEFMGGFQNVIASGGFSEFGALSPDQRSSKGINNQNSVGMNLNFSKSKKLKINANYLFAGSDRSIRESGDTETFGGNFNFRLQDTTTNENTVYNHRLNTKLKLNPSPSTNIIWSNKFFGLIDNQVRNSQSKYLEGNRITNTTTSDLDLGSNSLSFNSKFIFRKKFKKKGRNMSLVAGYEQLNRDELLDLETSLGSLTLLSETNQIQNFTNRQSIQNASVSFTEPIGKKIYLNTSYDYLDKSENPVRNYLNRVGSETVLDDDLSGDFTKDWRSHRLGLSIKRNRKKLKLNTGLDLQFISLDAFDNKFSLNDTDRMYWLPSGSAEWSLKGSKRIEFSYNTNIQEPSIGQMVNQVNNANPNLIVLGNSSLVPEYNHTISVRYNFYDSFNFSSFFWNLTSVLSPNKIVNARSFIDGVVTEIRPINSTGFSAFSGYVNYSTPIRKLKIKLGINSRANYSRYNTIVEEEMTKFSNASVSSKFTIENRKKDIFDIAGGVDLNLSAFSSEVSSNFSNPFFNYDLFLDGFINLGNDWSISSKYDLRTYNNGFFNNRRVINLLQASIQKAFLEKQLIVKLTAFDLLNQNLGIDRTGNVNTLFSSRFNTLGRYFLIGLSYRIGVKKKSGVEVLGN